MLLVFSVIVSLVLVKAHLFLEIFHSKSLLSPIYSFLTITLPNAPRRNVRNMAPEKLIPAESRTSTKTNLDVRRSSSAYIAKTKDLISTLGCSRVDSNRRADSFKHYFCVVCSIFFQFCIPGLN